MKSSTIMRLIVRNRENIALLNDGVEQCKEDIEFIKTSCHPDHKDLAVSLARNDLKKVKKSLAKAVQDQVELKRELKWQQTRENIREQIYGDTK